MGRQAADRQRDRYELDHQVNASNPRNFFLGHHLISDQISRKALAVIWDELEAVFKRGTAGDIVEFGCYVGTTSLFIRRQLDRCDQSAVRSYHVYDSFEGLPAKTAADMSAAGTDFQGGALQVSKRQFLEQFKRAGLTPPIIHKAWFHDLQPSDIPPSIALAFLDGDFYESIKDSFELVLPRMAKGGVIIIDDYANPALPGAAKAVRAMLPGHAPQIIHGLGVIRL